MVSHLSEHMDSSEKSGSDENDGYNVWTPDSEASIETGPFLSEPIAVIGMGMCMWHGKSYPLLTAMDADIALQDADYPAMLTVHQNYGTFSRVKRELHPVCLRPDSILMRSTILTMSALGVSLQTAVIS